MNKIMSRLLGTLPKKLATAGLIGLAAFLPVAASAAETVKIEGAVGVANVSAGDTKYAESVNATYDQVVKVEVYYHNQEQPDSGKIAEKMNVKIDMPTAAGKSQVIKGTIKGDNTNTVTDQATVNLDRDDATLQYIPGSAVWKHNVGTNDNVNYQEEKISDVVVTDGQGITLEDEKPCYNFSATVTVLARVMVPGVKVVKTSEVKGDTNKWANNNTAKPGDTMKYRIEYENTGNTVQKNVVIRDSLPAHLTLVPGTTKLYNATYPQGSAVASNDVVNGGIVIGNYGAGSNAYLMFEAKVDDADKLQCGATEIRNVGVARPESMNEYYNTSITTINKDCGSAQTPTYTCDALAVTKGDGRKVNAKVTYTAKNGATLKSITYNFGDGSTPLTTDKTSVDYTYTKDGNYTVSASLVVTADGKDQTVTAAACSKPVSFTTPTTPTTPTPVTPTALPNTGAGDVIGIFVGASIAGMIGYRLFLNRRLARQ